jgi:poly(3-hydroxybutyrate) depolymerase
MKKNIVLALMAIMMLTLGCYDKSTTSTTSKLVYPQGTTKIIHFMGRQEQRYLLFVPFGSPPPGGWKMLITVIDKDQDAKEIMEYWLSAMGEKSEYIVVAPYFQPGFKDFTHNDDFVLVQIIEEVKEKNQIHPHGIYIGGVGEGAEFAYRFAFVYPAIINKAVCISASKFDKPNDFAKKVKFLFVTGNKADPNFIKAAKDFNKTLLKALFETDYVIVPDEDDKISVAKCKKALEFLAK